MRRVFVLLMIGLVSAGCSVSLGSAETGIRVDTEDFLVEQFEQALPSVETEVSCSEPELLVVPCRVVVDGQAVAYEGVVGPDGRVEVWPVGATVVDGGFIERNLATDMPSDASVACPVVEVVALGEEFRCDLGGSMTGQVAVVFSDPQGTVASIELVG
ncbi:MAG: hypothetical protein AAGA99_18290 [Actinomycetota bacterium]